MRLLAEGRASEIYDLGDGRVLRRFKAGGDQEVLERHVEERAAGLGQDLGAETQGGIDVEPPPALAEREDGGVAVEALLLRLREADAVRVVAAAPAGGVVVRRDHHTFSNVPRRSSCS